VLLLLLSRQRVETHRKCLVSKITRDHALALGPGSTAWLSSTYQSFFFPFPTPSNPGYLSRNCLLGTVPGTCSPLKRVCVLSGRMAISTARKGLGSMLAIKERGQLPASAAVLVCLPGWTQQKEQCVLLQTHKRLGRTRAFKSLKLSSKPIGVSIFNSKLKQMGQHSASAYVPHCFGCGDLGYLPFCSERLRPPQEGHYSCWSSQESNVRKRQNL